MDQKLNLYGGFLGDERCISLASWTEAQVLKTLSDASTYAARNNCSQARALNVALQAFRSWGIVQETELSKVLVSEKPNIDKFIRFSVVKFASTLVQDDDTNTFNVRTIVPSSGQYLRDIHIEMSARPEIHQSEFMTNPVVRKICIHDAMRSCMDKYTECIPARPRPSVDEIQPGDSVSQVGIPSFLEQDQRQQQAAASLVSSARPQSDIAPSDKPSETHKEVTDRAPEALQDSSSLFQKNVQSKLREMQDENAPDPGFDASSEVSKKSSAD